MEDLHKDIETIWRELQEIDKLTQADDGDGEKRWVLLTMLETFIFGKFQLNGESMYVDASAEIYILFSL